MRSGGACTQLRGSTSATRVMCCCYAITRTWPRSRSPRNRVLPAGKRTSAHTGPSSANGSPATGTLLRTTARALSTRMRQLPSRRSSSSSCACRPCWSQVFSSWARLSLRRVRSCVASPAHACHRLARQQRLLLRWSTLKSLPQCHARGRVRLTLPRRRVRYRQATSRLRRCSLAHDGRVLSWLRTALLRHRRLQWVLVTEQWALRRRWHPGVLRSRAQHLGKPLVQPSPP